MAVACADKIHNMESLLSVYEVEGPALWEKFNRGKEKKLWFEQEMLAMLKRNWNHPMIEEYEGLVQEMEQL